MQSCKVGMWREYHLSIMGKGKGSLLKCSVKNGIYYKGKGLDLKAEPPRIKLR